MGGRIGYSAATGIMVVVLSWFGIISVLLALVPVVAISPILLYIGMLIGAQAFQTTPIKHAPAVVLALTPHLAAWPSCRSTPCWARPSPPRSGGRTRRRQARRGQSSGDRRIAATGRDLSRAGSDGRRRDPYRPRARAIGVFVIERDFVKPRPSRCRARY